MEKSEANGNKSHNIYFFIHLYWVLSTTTKGELKVPYKSMHNEAHTHAGGHKVYLMCLLHHTQRMEETSPGEKHKISALCHIPQEVFEKRICNLHVKYVLNTYRISLSI